MRSHVSLLVFASLFLGGIATGQPAPVPVAGIVQGVQEIAAPGIPGVVYAFGDSAAPVVDAPVGRNVRGSVVVAGTLGRGRVVAFGHTGYFDAGTLDAADTGRLMLNALGWASAQRPDGPVGVRGARSLASWLAEHGVGTLSLDGKDWLGKLKTCAALCIPAARIPRGPGAEAVVEFVRAGGGLVVCDTPWGWQQLNPGKSLADDHPGNQVLARAGIVLAGGLTRRSSPKGFAVGPINELVHAGRALEALVQFTAGKLKLDDKQLSQASQVLVATLRALPSSENKFRPKLLATVQAHAHEAVPRPDKPVTVKQPLARLAVVLKYERVRKLPPEKVEADPSAAAFPGAVPADAERVTKTVEVECSVPDWHSTGLYAPPGEIITVRTSAEAVSKKLAVRIGCHKDGIWHHSAWKRMPEITVQQPLCGEETKLASPFGGLIYIVVPRGQSGKVSVTISGAVLAPWFIYGKTTPLEWRTKVRNFPAPWAEFQSDRVILTVPSEVARKVEDPERLMTFWNMVLDADADLAQRPRERIRPERYVADVQISAGYMHSGYPIMTHLDAAPRMVNWAGLCGPKRKPAWGLFHEMGHNHQSGDWTFGGTGEVTVNLFTMYVLETVCGIPVEQGHPAIRPEGRAKKLREYFTNGLDFNRWKSDPFLALIMYMQLKEAFGWETYKKVFAEYRSLPPEGKPKNDQEKRDQWMVRFSRACGYNLGPFFQAWGVPTSEQARESIAELPVWMPAGFPPKVEGEGGGEAK